MYESFIDFRLDYLTHTPTANALVDLRSGGDLEVTTPNVLVTTYEKPVGSPEKSLPSGPDPSAGCSPKTGKDEGKDSPGNTSVAG